MTLSLAERHRQALLGGLATVATSLSLFPALQQKHYFIIGIGLTLVVVGIGMLVRQLHLPTVVAPVVQVVVVSELLLLVYGGYSKYGFIPTAKTFSTISRIISAGMDIANRYAAPVPRSPGLMLMTVGFIALVAIVVDLLAAGIGRAPLAGLALLALYSVPVAALPKGVPALAFIPGAAAFLVLLMVSERERLAHWGRHVARSTIRDHSETIDTSGLAMSGRRISVFAIAMAVVLPIVVPNFSHTLFHGQEGLGSGNGGSLSFNDPMVSLANSLHLRQPIDLIDVSSPSTEPSYLRLAVLDDPGPNAWTNSGVNLSTTVAADGALPPPVGLGTDVARVRRQMNISLTGDFSRASDVWLPVPFGLSRLNLRFEFGGQPSDFAYVPNDQTVTSRTSGALSEASTYTATYQDVEPTEQELRGAGQPPADIVSEFGRVPAGVPSIVGEEARNITAGLTNDYDRALALQSFFRDGQFTYDLNAAYGYGYQSMARFLQLRHGFCQHFAATMAMMAREIGIPSRVVVGFLSPSRHDNSLGYVFTSRDAHAWPELFFAGVGWVRFEPTPGNGAVIPPYTHAVSIPHVGSGRPTQSTPTSPGAAGGKNPTEGGPTTAAAGGTQGTGGGGGSVPPLGWLVLVVVVALALTPGLIRWGVRRSRMARAIDGGPSCEFAWLELRDRVVDLRLPWTGSLTPRARRRFVEPLLGGDPDGVAALDRLSLTVERARYAGSPLTDAQPSSDAREVMAAIGRGADWKQRLRAFLWPASLMPEIRGGWSRMVSRLRRPEPSQP